MTLELKRRLFGTFEASDQTIMLKNKVTRDFQNEQLTVTPPLLLIAMKNKRKEKTLLVINITLSRTIL